MDNDLKIIRGTNDKPVSSDVLIETLNQSEIVKGELFLGYPIIGTPEGRTTIDALLISPDRGAIIFDLVEGDNPTNYDIRQDDSATKLEARLKTHSELVKRRQLLIPIYTITLAPGLQNLDQYKREDYPLSNGEDLVALINRFTWDNESEEVYKRTLSSIQNISTIRSARTKRVIVNSNSKGAKLKNLEGSIATLDNLQGKAVLETAKGVQRIRGLAGSGKTIVLALKAAYLHAQHPEWRIAVTFNTRSLKGQFERLITNFSLEQAGEEPDWERIKIISAWGAPGGEHRDGIYYEFCRINDVEYHDFSSARNKFGRGNEFNGVYKLALKQTIEPKEFYDAILVDEAQDFPPSFLRLCYTSLNNEKRLVYAYDELQNLSGTSLPGPEKIFGEDKDGKPLVKFDNIHENGSTRDIILKKCYRNSRPVLVTAHALGFGIYREPPKENTTGLIQMFDYPELWEEIGYKTKKGNLREGKRIVLYRPESSSPKFLEEHSDIADLIKFIRFNHPNEQIKWLTNAIRMDLKRDELRYDDIVVIHPDPIKAREKLGPIRRKLHDLGIRTHLTGVDTDPDVFFKQDSIPFTGIYRAKGNEAAMVYIVNAQDCDTSSLNLAKIRNRLFTAITRSKAWVRVLGVGQGMQNLIGEYEKLKKASFELDFVYPTKDERKQLEIIHRDMSESEKRKIENKKKSLEGLIQDLESGQLHIEDLDSENLRKLMKLIEEQK